jgi:probable HAF family extracellular repeat protein
LLFCLIFSSLPFAGDYRFVRIDVPGATATFAQGINARGDIGGRYNDSEGSVHGFLLQHGVFSKVDFPHASFTAARAINAQGEIVGRTIDRGGNEHGFLLRNGRFTRIDYPGAAATTARGINNAGDITGRHFDAAGNENGFVLQAGKYHNISVPDSLTPFHPCSTDVWMAMDNERVLISDFCTDPDGGVHGYLRKKAGEFAIVDFPGAAAPCSALRWINERGDIVGVYANTLDECFNFQAHGFLLKDGALGRRILIGMRSSRPQVRHW